MKKIIREDLISYDFDDIPYEFYFEFKDYISERGFSEDEKINLINSYATYNPDLDVDDQLDQIKDRYIKDHIDEIKDYYEDEALEEFSNEESYKDDPYNYNGVSPRDFF